MNHYAFDIEVKGCELIDALKFKPTFEAASNIKDPIKIAAAIAEKEQNWQNGFALSPLTGVVLVAGFKDIRTGERIYFEGDENTVLTATWKFLTQMYSGDFSATFYGHYLYHYDIPMLIRRSWALGVTIPAVLGWEKRQWESCGIYDTAHLWALGGYGDEKYISLDFLAKHLGVGAKNGKGADFAELYAKNKKKAFEYFDNDLDLAGDCAKIMFNIE